MERVQDIDVAVGRCHDNPPVSKENEFAVWDGKFFTVRLIFPHLQANGRR